MPTTQTSRVAEQLRQVALLRDGGGLSDGQLLGAFAGRRDEAAFAALVRRHGPMVLGVCRRVLRHAHDAEDAFQAVFLILARRAASLEARAGLANWLYGVAYRTSLRARAVATRRRAREKQVTDMPEPPHEPEEVWRGLEPLLDRELSRLPDRYRTPVVLCDLQGKTRREAARQLGVPEGTLSGRLTTARRMLARRLARHGLALSGGALAAALSAGTASASVPASLGATTVKAAGGAAATGVSARAAVLAEGVMKMMLLNRLARAAGAAAVVAILLAAGVLLGRGLAQEAGAGDRPAAQKAGADKPARKAPAREGRLYFYRDAALTTVAPDGEKAAHLGRPAGADLLGYQILADRLSPDGKRIAFGKGVQRDVDGRPHFYPPEKIYLRDAAKPGPGEVLAEMPGAEIHNFVWSPDGKRLAFNTWDKENSGRSWVVEVGTKKVEEVKLPRFKRKDKEYAMTIQAWSPDGKSFLAAGDGLHLLKTDGTGARRLTKEGRSVLSGSCEFSPDGRRVLFVAAGEGERETLHVADVANGKERALVDAMNFTNLHGCWSPDGKRVAYVATPIGDDGKSGTETTLFVVDLESGGTTTVLTEKHRPREVKLRLVGWR